MAVLLSSLACALDPDETDLTFRFQLDGLLYRGRFLRGRASTGVRPQRRGREAPVEGTELALRAPVRVPGLLEGTLSLLRRRRRPWTGAERMRFGLLRPFLTQLLSTLAQRHLDAEARRWLEAAADSAEAPILFFREDGSILFANQAADTLLQNQTERGLAAYAEDHRVTPLVNHLIRWASGSPESRRTRIALTNGQSLEARLIPVNGTGAQDPVIRLVTLHGHAALRLDDVWDHLQARGVSDREADVVRGVLEGLRNAEIASRLYITEYTVKDHLKHIFQKVGVSSRGGLVRALYDAQGGPAPPLT